MQKLRIIILMLLILSLVIGNSALADQGPDMRQTADEQREPIGEVQAMGTVRMREEPNRRAVVVGQIGWGKVADLMSISPDAAWYEIEYEEVTGWVSAEWFQIVAGAALPITQPAQTIPTTETATEDTTPLMVDVGVTDVTIVRSMGTVRIRNTPGRGSDVIGQIGWGETALLLSVEGEWYEIDFNGLQGWVAAEWFRLESGVIDESLLPEEADSTDEAATESETATIDDTPLTTTGMVQSMGTVRIRTAPGGGESIGNIGWGELAALLDIDESGEWYFIEYNGMEGWVSAAWFQVVSGELPGENIATEETETDAPESEPVTETVPVTQPASTTAGASGLVKSMGTLRIRTEPGGGESIGNIGWGQIAILLEIDESGGWYLVDYNGTIGWVSAEWMRIESGEAPPTTLIVVEDEVDGQGGGSLESEALIQAMGTVRIRENPSLKSARIGQIGWGEQATLIGIDESGSWYQIDYNGVEGWVLAEWFVPVSGEIMVPSVATVQALTETTAPEEALVAAVTVPVTSVPDGNRVQAFDNVRIRTNPTLTSGSLGNIGWGQIANLLSVDPSGQWYQIEYNGVTGWVWAAWFVRIGDAAAGAGGGLPESFVPNEDQPSVPAPTAGAYLRIPRLGINSPIVEFPIVLDPEEGAIWYISPNERYVGHLEGTTTPGQVGNVALGAHSEYANGQAGLFGSLGSLASGDEIILTVGGVPKRYVVTRIFTVPFTDVSVVLPGGSDRLTLFTCTTYSPSQGIYLDRLVVVAEAVE